MVSGHLKLSDEWEPIVYATLVHSLQDFYLCSDQLIISSAPLNEAGHFSLTFDLLDQTQFIRLHVSKSGGPAATLIIGGPDQNHGFFAVEDGGRYQLQEQNDTSILFKHFALPDQLNKNLSKVEWMIKVWEKKDRTLKESSTRIHERQRLIRQLETFSDTCSQMLASLYALHRSDMGFNRERVLEKLQKMASQSENHIYLLPYQIPGSNVNFWLLLISLPFVVYLSHFIKKRIHLHRQTKKVEQLSPQEIKVATLLLNGMSNKEIASTLHVEISTIKSHIYRIFSKLEIDSRREIRKFAHQIQQT